MYNFTCGILVMAFVGFGFYQWDTGHFFGKLLAFIIIGGAVAFFFRWEKRLFPEE